MRLDLSPKAASEPADPTRAGSHERLRQRSTAPLPAHPLMLRDGYDGARIPPQGSSPFLQPDPASSFAVETASSFETERRGWRRCLWPWGCEPAGRERAQTSNQRGWLGHFLRWMPLAGVIIGSTSLYFAVRNYRLIYAQRTFSLLKQTGPALTRAHNDILDGLIKLQQALNIGNTSMLEPPLPPESDIPDMPEPGR